MAIEQILQASARGPSPEEDSNKKPNVLLDVAASPFRGVEGALQGIYDLADFATGDNLLPDYNHRFLGRSQTFAGSLGEGVTQFLTGFIPVAGQLGKVGALTKVAKGGKTVLNLKGTAAAGAVADFSVFQAQEERLSNLVQAFPSLENPITEYLAADEDDGEIEGRFKNTVEGLALGGLVDGLFGAVKAIKRGQRGDDPVEITNDLADTLFSAQRDQNFLRNELTEQTEKFQQIVSEKFGGAENAPQNAYDMLVAMRDGYEGELAPLFDALIEFAPKTLQDAKFEFNKIDNGNSAQYSIGEHKITMEKGGYNSFAHELLHAVTAKEIDVQLSQALKDGLDIRPQQSTASAFVSNNKEIIQSLAENSASPIAGLFRSYLSVVEKVGKEAEVFGREDASSNTSIYGLSNIDEFIAEAFTNPEFRSMLSKIPSDGDASKSIFDEFLSAIKSMLGLSDAQTSILDNVMRDTEGVLRQQEAAFEAKFDFMKGADDLLGQRPLRTFNQREFNTGENRAPRRLEGGFDPRGKGTPEGDGKDKAMREVADSAIVEIEEGRTRRSSSQTSLDTLGNPTADSEVIMLARNGSLRNKPLREETKAAIKNAHDNGTSFVVGDMPGADSRFIDWLEEIGADFTIFHTGDKPRVLEGLSTRDLSKDVDADTKRPTRDKTLDKFKITWGVPFKGKDISEVPAAYLKRSLSFRLNTVNKEARERISEELAARKAGKAQEPEFSTTAEIREAKRDAEDAAKKKKGKVEADKGIRGLDPEPSTPVYRGASKEQALTGEVETPEQLYANYLKHREGGKASNSMRLRLDEYKAGLEQDARLRGNTDSYSPRIQGKSQRSSDIERSKRLKLPSDPITDARNRGRMFSEGVLGQRGFYSNVSKAADELFSRHMDDTKGLADKNEKIGFERLKKLLIKKGDAGTKEELEFRGFDEYFQGTKDKDKISRAEFEEFLKDSEFNFEFEPVNDLTATEARMIDEALAMGEDLRAGEIAESAGGRIEAVNGEAYKQSGPYSNPQNYALREPGDAFDAPFDLIYGFGESNTQALNKQLQSRAVSHFGDDVIYHVRTTDRELDGNKVLYVEEIQSDLHTAFKKQTFEKWRESRRKEIRRMEEYLREHPENQHAKEGSAYRKELKAEKDKIEDFQAARKFYNENKKLADKRNVPFMQNGFHNNAARQLLKMAAEKGYDAVWLPNGEQIQQLYGQGNKYGFYNTTYRNALEKAAKNLDPRYGKLYKRKVKKAQPTRQLTEEQQAQLDNLEAVGLADELDPFFEGDEVIEAFEGGFGIKISGDMRFKAQEDMPIFGQRDIDIEVENSIDRLANDLETGGDQAVLNAAKGIRSTTQAVAIVQAMARNLAKAPTKEPLTAEQLIAENKEVVDILGGNEGNYAATIAGIRDSGLGLESYRHAQKAVYSLIDLLSSNVVDVANKAKEARTNPNLNKAQLEAELLSTLDQLHEVQRIWSLMGRESSYTLLQRKFLLNPEGAYRVKKGIGFDPKSATAKDTEKYVSENQVGTMTAEKLVNTLAEAKDAADAKKRIKQTSQMAKETMGSKAMDVVMEYWMNSLLSGPTTQVVNILGNSLTLAMRTIEQATGAALTGNPQLAIATLKYAFDMESISESLKLAAQTFGKQEATLTQGRRQFDDKMGETKAIAMEGKGAVASTVNTLGTIVRIPSRALLAGDEFFKQINYRSFVKTHLAYEAMKKGGKNGPEVAEYVNKNFNNFITQGARAYNERGIYLDAVEAAKARGILAGKEQDEFIKKYIEDNPFDEKRGGLADAALGFAEENTFTSDINDETVIGSLSQMLNTLKNKGGFWQSLNFVIPFLRTPTNILQFSLDRTPFGTASELIFRRDKMTKDLQSDDPFVRAQTRGKLATSAAVSAAVLYYVSANKEFITGGGPPNRDELEALRKTGWMPYSIKIGDTYYSYQRLDPLATIIGLFADMVEGHQYNDLEGIVSQDMMAITIMALTNNVTNKSYVKGLDTLVNLVRDPVTNFEPFAGNIVGGFAPTLLTQIQNMADERVLRETRGAFDYFLKKIPGAEATLPARRDFLGEVRKNTNSPYMTGVINPVYFSKDSNDPVDKELAALQHGFSQPPTKLFNAIEMRDVYNEEGRQAYDRYLELSGTTKIGGKTLRQSLNKLISNKAYQKMPVESADDLGEKSPRIKAVQRLVRLYRRKAKNEMLKEFPELQNSIQTLQKQRTEYRLVQ